MSTVAVVGVGAIGGFCAAQLARVCDDGIVLCVRRPFQHLVVESPTGTTRMRLPVITAPSDATAVDWVLLATKVHQTAAAKPWLDRLCGPTTRVLVLQNGVEHAARVGSLVAGAEIIPAVVYCDATAVAPGHIVHRSGGRLIIPQCAAGHEAQDLFGGTDVQVHLTSDFVTAAWTKLCLNVAINSITAITGQGIHVMRRPDVANLAFALIAECLDVGKRVGAKFDGTRPTDLVDFSSLPDDAGSSTLDDRRAGRSLEHDALNGAVVRIGAFHGVATPLNSAMLALLAAISESSAGRDRA